MKSSSLTCGTNAGSCAGAVVVPVSSSRASEPSPIHSAEEKGEKRAGASLPPTNRWLRAFLETWPDQARAARTG